MPSLQWRDRKVTAALKTVLIVCLLAGSAHTVEAGDEDSLWEAVRTGAAFAIMRHALAPGTGDPDHFTLGDCSTQRNLSNDRTFPKNPVPRRPWC